LLILIFKDLSITGFSGDLYNIYIFSVSLVIMLIIFSNWLFDFLKIKFFGESVN